MPGGGAIRAPYAILAAMRISVAADELTGIARVLVGELERRGHDTLRHGALAESERDDWPWASEAAARDVAECIAFVATRPPRVNVEEVLVLATAQVGATKVFRR